MRVSKWGNSLAVRLPKSVVEALKLKAGDKIEIHVAGDRDFAIARDRIVQEAIEGIRRMARPFPPDFKFDRDEANER